MKPTQQAILKELTEITQNIPNFFGSSDQIATAISMINEAIVYINGTLK